MSVVPLIGGKLYSKSGDQLLYTINFCAGLAWKAFTLLALYGSPTAVPLHSEVTYAWVVALVTFVLANTAMVYLFRWQLDLKEKATHSSPKVRVALNMTDSSIDCITGWGLAFVIAAHLDMAVQASDTDNDCTEQILYVVVMLVLMSVIGTVTEYYAGALGVKRAGIRHKLAISITGGSVYLIAMGWQRAANTILNLETVSVNSEAAYAWEYTGVVVLVTGLYTLVLHNNHAADFNNKMVKLSQESSETFLSARQTFDWAAVKVTVLFGKVLSMVCVVTLYKALKIETVKQIPGDPIKAAAMAVAATVFVAIVGGALVDYLLNKSLEGVKGVDRDYYQGSLDDYLLDYTQAVLKVSQDTFTSGLGWLMSLSVNSLFLELGKSVTENWDAATYHKLFFFLGYAMLMTGLAVGGSIWKLFLHSEEVQKATAEAKEGAAADDGQEMGQSASGN